MIVAQATGVVCDDDPLPISCDAVHHVETKRGLADDAMNHVSFNLPADSIVAKDRSASVELQG